MFGYLSYMYVLSVCWGGLKTWICANVRVFFLDFVFNHWLKERNHVLPVYMKFKCFSSQISCKYPG